MPKSVHAREVGISPKRKTSRLSKVRGRQVQSGQGRTGHDRSLRNRSRR